MNFDAETLDEILQDYGALYGESAEKYARNTYHNWKRGATQLSGKTLERLVELVPPYLSAETRYSLIQAVLKRHPVSKPNRYIRINGKEPEQGLAEVDAALAAMNHDDQLAFVPEQVMMAANWLYDEDITSARAMMAEAVRCENEIMKASASREIALLKRTILSGQLKSASYTVTMPSGTLSIVVYQPSKCFIATVCYGQNARQTIVLRRWRDQTLIMGKYGRKFVVWYYRHGEFLSKIIARSWLLLTGSKVLINLLVRFIDKQGRVDTHE